jgi:hypothetical protein
VLEVATISFSRILIVQGRRKSLLTSRWRPFFFFFGFTSGGCFREHAEPESLGPFPQSNPVAKNGARCRWKSEGTVHARHCPRNQSNFDTNSSFFLVAHFAH